MEQQNEATEPLASGVWLTDAQTERLRKVLSYLWEQEEAHFDEAPEEQREAHIFNEVRALNEVLQQEALLKLRLRDGKPEPVLVVHALERPGDDRLEFGVNELFDVVLRKVDEGLVVDIFPWDPKYGCHELLGSTYAFDHEAVIEDDEPPSAAHGG